MNFLSSLRSRLVVVPSAILLAGLAATIAFYFYRAQIRVQAETGSGLRLARVLVDAALDRAQGAADPATALERLQRELPTIRHVDFVILQPASFVRVPGMPVVKEERRAVPLWFSRLFNVPMRAEAFPIVIGGHMEGQVIVVPNPLNEIAEIWDELAFLAGLLLVLAVIIVGLLVWTVHRGLRPIRELAAAFDRLEHGWHEELHHPIRVAELSRIGIQFNSLVRSLRRVTEDNHLLIDKLISVQEAERKEIARELHDEFGPSLFGIRADVSCILRWSRGREPRFREIEERALSIAELADTIQRTNSRMLDRLRPLVLDQLGLPDALQQLVNRWQERYPGISWKLDIAPALTLPDEEASLTLYRVVQESLTNVVRHADARTVEISVQIQGADGRAAGIAVLVRDDGRGFPRELRFGFGLLGISERIRGREGRLQVGNAPSGGALIEAFLPLGAVAA
jgi:two-component system sensor histidine kinase UhpB